MVILLKPFDSQALLSLNSLESSGALKDIQFHWSKLSDRNSSRHEKSVQSCGISLNGSRAFLILMMAKGEQLLWWWMGMNIWRKFKAENQIGFDLPWYIYRWPCHACRMYCSTKMLVYINREGLLRLMLSNIGCPVYCLAKYLYKMSSLMVEKPP